jgi:flagella basal body P-ring formation protein FlgA
MTRTVFPVLVRSLGWRRLRAIALTCACAPLALSAAAAADVPDVRIALRANAAVAGVEAKLGDLADIGVDDPALAAELGAVVVAAVPRQGYTEVFTREQVASRVRQHVATERIEWSGAAQVRVRGLGQQIPLEQLSDAAVRALSHALAGQYATLSLKPLAKVSAITVPAGAVELQARMPAAQRLAPRMSALVEVRIDGQLYTTVPVWFAVRATQNALDAREALGPGTGLAQSAFDIVPVDVTKLATVPADAALAGLQLRRPLQPGQPLSANLVERRPAVARDARVAVRVVAGAVTIETTGVALSDARLGEAVQVRNPRSQEAFAARVVGEGVVQVGAL